MTGNANAGAPGETQERVWVRGLIMLAFIFLFGIGQTIMNLGAVVQFLWLVFMGQPNAFLIRFGRSLAAWLSEVAHFLFMDTNKRPFPWSPWPESQGIRDLGC